jgi:hypothetical protein
MFYVFTLDPFNYGNRHRQMLKVTKCLYLGEGAHLHGDGLLSDGSRPGEVGLCVGLEERFNFFLEKQISLL